jgi:hypothetical protein
LSTGFPKKATIWWVGAGVMKRQACGGGEFIPVSSRTSPRARRFLLPIAKRGSGGWRHGGGPRPLSQPDLFDTRDEARSRRLMQAIDTINRQKWADKHT